MLDRERTEMRHNSEWLEMPSAELFELVRRFTVARLLERDDFQRRMEREQAISILELLYPVLQGYDSVAIEADVELGGSDQKFNLLFGRDVQEAFGKSPQSILTMPILVGTDGVRKMSKSYDNYVGVTDEPEEMFGRLMSIPDEVMADYYLLLLGRELDPAAHPNEAKRSLARELVARFHDERGRAGSRGALRLHPQVGARSPRTCPRCPCDGDGDVHLPALIARAFGDLEQRGAAPPRAGRGPARRRDRRRRPAGPTVRGAPRQGPAAGQAALRPRRLSTPGRLALRYTLASRAGGQGLNRACARRIYLLVALEAARRVPRVPRRPAERCLKTEQRATGFTSPVVSRFDPPSHHARRRLNNPSCVPPSCTGGAKRVTLSVKLFPSFLRRV